MLQKKREIYIKLDKIKELVEILEEINKLQEETKGLFKEADKTIIMENRIFENWGNYLEEISLNLDHISI